MNRYHCQLCDTDYDNSDASFVGYVGDVTHKRERCLEVRLARAEVQRDEALAQLNTPELYDFAKAVRLEGAHQRERWGTEHDEGKAPADWFWLIGYLAGKALASHIKGDVDKALHHTVTAAAALANWHSTILGKTNMRPGIARPAGEDLLAEATERAGRDPTNGLDCEDTSGGRKLLTGGAMTEMDRDEVLIQRARSAQVALDMLRGPVGSYGADRDKVAVQAGMLLDLAEDIERAIADGDAPVTLRRRVYLESPFHAPTPEGLAKNRDFLIACMRDSIARGEASFAIHLIYTQVLDDGVASEREAGIECGLAWAAAGAAATVVYTNLGTSPGMQRGIDEAQAIGRPVEYRQLQDWGAATFECDVCQKRTSDDNPPGWHSIAPLDRGPEEIACSDACLRRLLERRLEAAPRATGARMTDETKNTPKGETVPWNRNRPTDPSRTRSSMPPSRTGSARPPPRAGA